MTKRDPSGTRHASKGATLALISAASMAGEGRSPEVHLPQAPCSTPEILTPDAYASSARKTTVAAPTLGLISKVATWV